MATAATAEPTTRRLEVPGAVLAYDVRAAAGTGGAPPLSTRIVLAAGADSEGELAHRGAHAVAERLGTTAVTFPSGHAGFLGGEYGQTGEPDAFAARLREVLDGRA